LYLGWRCCVSTAQLLCVVLQPPAAEFGCLVLIHRV
jgi:hypothetical protein